MFSYLRHLLIAVVVCGLLSAVSTGCDSASNALGKSSNAQYAASETYGPYKTYQVANTKAKALQARGYTTIVHTGHSDPQNYYVSIVK